jgi:hypothetical protein
MEIYNIDSAIGVLYVRAKPLPSGLLKYGRPEKIFVG